MTREDSPTTVLVVDDEEDMRQLVCALLARAGLDVVDEALDGPEALLAIERLDPPPVPTVIVLDQLMPGMTGLEVAKRVLEQFPSQRIVLFSAFLTEDLKRQAAEIGVRACVSKTDVARLPSLITALVDGP
jgi:CheY-like chemotaxis protein